VLRIWEDQLPYIHATAIMKITPAHGCSSREIVPPPSTTASQNSHGDQKARPVSRRYTYDTPASQCMSRSLNV